mgnify:CR=1 FL=1
MKCHRMLFASDDVRSCAHRSGDQAGQPLVGLDGALAGDPQLATAEALALGEVVVAVDALASAALADGLEQRLDPGLVGDVGRQGDRAAALVLDAGGELLDAVGAPGGQRDGGAGAGAGQRGGLADARGGARDGDVALVEGARRRVRGPPGKVAASSAIASSPPRSPPKTAASVGAPPRRF